MSIFTSERVSAHLTRIITPCGVCMYLAEGTQRAALLDTGFGFGDLKGYVDALTEKPYVVLLSHGHMDHAGGAVQFDEVYLNERDWALEKWHSTRERRIFDVHHGPGGMPAGVTDDDFLPSRTKPYLPLEEGDVFDLGGVTVCPVAVPGHTAGSLVFLLPEDRIAIFGDACGEHTLLLFRESAPIAEYRKGLLHMQEQADRFDIVLRNHGSFCSPKQILADNIELCGDILNGTDAAIDSDFMGMKGRLGRPHEHPGKVGNILYDPNKLR
ncbi:MAG: MBL fold metallo-hydrolase [Clostridia bacterium]|nr:MBL fold metallo-hydrolase [Clostridia bacterium]